VAGFPLDLAHRRAQGFAAFNRNEGRARFIVGADLDPNDVAAILRGEEARRDAALLAALGDPEDWPEEVRDDVALLPAMVAHQRLELRVAFRVHMRTRHPLPRLPRPRGTPHGGNMA
jgi:hypothetical protein